MVYRDWKKCASGGEVRSILVATYQAALRGWDFTKATTCIFVQQPWLAGYKAHTLRPFFNLDLVRTTKLCVLEVNEGELINGVVGKMCSKGAKI